MDGDGGDDVAEVIQAPKKSRERKAVPMVHVTSHNEGKREPAAKKTRKGMSISSSIRKCIIR